MSELSREDIVLIIEALRVFQTTLEREPDRAAALAEEVGGPVNAPDTVNRIDALCERLNCG